MWVTMRYKFADIKTVIPKSTKLCHKGLGVVIGKGVVLGENCHIYPHVMIGKRSEGVEGYPVIGDNVILYTGSVVVGPIHVGDNVVIGANCFVCRDVPNDTVMRSDHAVPLNNVFEFMRCTK